MYASQQENDTHQSDDSTYAETPASSTVAVDLSEDLGSPAEDEGVLNKRLTALTTQNATLADENEVLKRALSKAVMSGTHSASTSEGKDVAAELAASYETVDQRLEGFEAMQNELRVMLTNARANERLIGELRKFVAATINAPRSERADTKTMSSGDQIRLLGLVDYLMEDYIPEIAQHPGASTSQTVEMLGKNMKSQLRRIVTWAGAKEEVEPTDVEAIAPPATSKQTFRSLQSSGTTNLQQGGNKTSRTCYLPPRLRPGVSRLPPSP